MKAVVVGAGLGGLATALRLQGLGAEVTVVEQRERPGGRAYQLRDGGFTWDTGPSLLTMPWVLEETFAAGGLDLHSEVTLHRLDPLYRIRWASEDAHLDFSSDPARLRAEVAKFSARDAAQVEPFLAALRPIYERGILGAGRRPFTSALDFARLVPDMVRLGRPAPAALASSRAGSSTRACARRSRSTRCSSAATRIGCPRSTPRSSTCRWLDGGWYAEGGTYAVVEAMAAPLDVRCGEAVEAIEHAGGRVTGVRLAGGERIAADVVVSNADVLRTHELVGRAAPRRRLRETMSCFLLYLGTDRADRRAAAPHAARRRRLPRVHPRRHARPRAAAHVLHLRPRAGAHRAGDGAARRRLARRAAPGAEPARGDRLGPRRRPAARRAARRHGDELRAGRDPRRGRRGAPDGAARLRARARRGVGQRVRRRADAAPVGLLPPAQPRPAARRPVLRGRRDASRARACPACCWAPRSPRAWSRAIAGCGP